MRSAVYPYWAVSESAGAVSLAAAAIHGTALPPWSREHRLARDCIERFALDLRGLTVFTEAATGPFAWTAIISLLAGAERVLAVAKASRYASRDEAAEAVLAPARALGLADRLDVVDGVARIGEADIVTNLAALRPIGEDVVRALRPTAVVALMWETWEYREADLDLHACFARDILVLGTNEQHLDLQIFRYLGLTAIKLLFELGLEGFRSRVVVVASGGFASAVIGALRQVGADVSLVGAIESAQPVEGCTWLAERLDSPAVRDALARADALLFAEHHADRTLVGTDGDLSAAALAECAPTIRVAHISGVIDAAGLRERGITVWPARVATIPRVMSVTTGYVGPRAVLELHAAGLRVGEEMARARLAGLGADAARARALGNPLCQDFSPEQRARYGAAPR